MLKKLAYLILAVLLAWHFSPVISSTFSFLHLQEAGGRLMPTDIFSQNFPFYLWFLICAAILWSGLNSFGISGLASPAQGASNTRLVRRIQGFGIEGGLVALLSLPALGLLFLTVGKTVILDRMQGDPGFVAMATAPLQAQADQAEKDISQAESQGRVLTLTKWWESAKDIFRSPDNRGTATAQVQSQVDATAFHSRALRNQRSETLSAMDALTEAYSRGDSSAVETVREAAWRAQAEDPWRLAYLAVTSLWMFALPTGIGLYVLLHRKIKHRLGGPSEKFLRFFRDMAMGFGGSSVFGCAADEWLLHRDLANLGDGLFMGRSLYNPWLFLTLSDERHMLTIGGSRTGKGSTTIIPTLLEWTGSVIVPDIRGTNAAVTARRRREMGQEVIMIDPFGLVTENTNGYNPLASLDPNSPTIREEISVIAEALVIPNPDPRAEHWDEGALTLIAGIIDHLVSSGKYENPTLPMVWALLGLPPAIDLDENSNPEELGANETAQPLDQAALWTEMLMSESLAGLARDAGALMTGGAGTDEVAGFLSNARKNVKWLGSRSIQKVLSQNGPSPFAKAKDKPTSIYIVLPAHWYNTHKRLFRLCINLCIMHMSLGGKAKVRNLLILDEFLALGKLAEVEKAYNLMAASNLVIWALAQNYGGIEELYGSAAQSFVTNSRAVQAFGVSDAKTTGFLAEQIGQRSLQTAWGSKKSDHVVYLRTPTEVAFDLEKDTRRQYIIRPGKPVILAERIDYFKPAAQPLFAGKYDQDPDHLNPSNN